MKRSELPKVRNGGVLPRAKIPLLSATRFRDTVLRCLEGGSRVACLFGHVGPTPELVAVLADDHDATLALVGATLAAEGDGPATFRSLALRSPEVDLFEREIAEQLGVTPVGHPALTPLRNNDTRDFYRVDGDAVHEVAVGPVHAGIIEPGHFRFQCHGEDVFHLEIALGYQHRGVERALRGGPDKRSLHYAETLAGDTTIGHTLAYARVVEALGGPAPSARAQVIRGIALELERLANHTGDLGALAGDVGFLPTAAYCGRIRGDFLNLTALLCGSRFGRGLVRPGGVAFDLDTARITELRARLAAAAKDVAVAVKLLWAMPSVMARFQDTGVVSRETCDLLGLVGPAARASGAARDVRKDFPFDIYRFSHVPTATWHSGDVFARAYVRWLEITHSLVFIEEQLACLPAGPSTLVTPPARPVRPVRPAALTPAHIAVSLVEGWRGELCHVALSDSAGRFEHYKVVDASFHNWPGLAMALRGQQISDFPLCNKSFNLSYCGHDL